MAKPDQTFNEMREIARELFRDLEKTSKLRRNVANPVMAVEADDVLNSEMCQEILDPSEVSINSARAMTRREVQPEGVLEQLQQLRKQHRQIAELLQYMLEWDTTIANQKFDGGGRGRSQVRCFYCKRQGHVKADCRKRLAHEQPRRAPQANDVQAETVAV